MTFVDEFDFGDKSPSKRKSHQTDPWYKRYPRDFYDDTRILKLDERGAYSDILDMIYMAEGPIRDDHGYLAHKLHCDVKTWKRIRGRLLALGFLFRTGEKLHQKRAKDVLKKREEERVAMGQRRADVGRTFAEASPNVGPHAKKNVIDIKDRLRASYTESSSSESEEEKERSSAPSNLKNDDDEKRKPKRRVSASVRTALANRVGEERAAELLAEYEGSDYAQKARVIDRAFVGWLNKTYAIGISARGDAVAMGAMAGPYAPPKPEPTEADKRLRARMSAPKTAGAELLKTLRK